MTIHSPIDPPPAEFGAFYSRYLVQVKGLSIADAMDKDSRALAQLFNNIPEEKGIYRYAAGKWSVKEVLLHCLDTERIFSTRALMLLRGEKKPIPGYDQDDYVDNSRAERYTFDELREQFNSIRASTLLLLKHASAEDLERKGIASGYPISVRAIGKIIPGHNLHHIEILKTRYSLG